jgi:hypothetical protein
LAGAAAGPAHAEHELGGSLGNIRGRLNKPCEPGVTGACWIHARQGYAAPRRYACGDEFAISLLNQGQTLGPGRLILQAEIDNRQAIVAEAFIEQAAIGIDAGKVHIR